MQCKLLWQYFFQFSLMSVSEYIALVMTKKNLTKEFEKQLMLNAILYTGRKKLLQSEHIPASSVLKWNDSLIRNIG